jgi:dolichol-phosphate mannosyltransferase
LTNDATIVRSPWAKFGRVAKFGVVGITGTLINTGLLLLLARRFQLPVPLASGIAVELAIISNFLLNSSWTFAALPSCRRFAKFNVASLAGLGINITGVWLLTSLGMYLLAADLIAIAAGFAVNYVISVVWVWGRAA